MKYLLNFNTEHIWFIPSLTSLYSKSSIHLQACYAHLPKLYFTYFVSSEDFNEENDGIRHVSYFTNYVKIENEPYQPYHIIETFKLFMFP